MLHKHRERAPAVIPIRHHQDAFDVAFSGQGNDLLAVFPGTPCRQQMNGLSRHTLLHGQAGGKASKARRLAGRRHVSRVPQFRRQPLLVQRDALVDALHITAQYDDRIRVLDA